MFFEMNLGGGGSSDISPIEATVVSAKSLSFNCELDEINQIIIVATSGSNEFVYAWSDEIPTIIIRHNNFNTTVNRYTGVNLTKSGNTYTLSSTSDFIGASYTHKVYAIKVTD